MNDLLDWISRNGAAAFLLGVFLLFLLGITAEFVVKTMRSITGNYPPAPPVSICTRTHADTPCYCCRENECDSDCRCYSGEGDNGA